MKFWVYVVIFFFVIPWIVSKSSIPSPWDVIIILGSWYLSWVAFDPFDDEDPTPRSKTKIFGNGVYEDRKDKKS